MKRVVVLALVVALTVTAGCAWLKTNKDDLRAAVRVATVVFLESNRDQAPKVVFVTATAIAAIDSGSVETAGNVIPFIKAQLGFDQLSPAAQVVYGEVLDRFASIVTQAIQEKFPDVTASEYVLQVREVLGWVNEAASLYAPSKAFSVE